MLVVSFVFLGLSSTEGVVVKFEVLFFSPVTGAPIGYLGAMLGLGFMVSGLPYFYTRLEEEFEFVLLLFLSIFFIFYCDSKYII